MILTLVQSTIFIAYVAFIWKKFGVLPSISESWYRLQGLEKSLFTFFCWGVGIPMLFQTDGTTAWFFCSGAGLGFVGAATMFRSGDKTTRWIHFIGAFAGMVCGLMGVGFERGDFTPSIIWVVISLIILLINFKNRMWWIEISAFFALIYGLLK